MHAISSESLSKAYRTGFANREAVKALDGVSLSVESGQIFSLLGPNGAGKTTFIKILLSIVRPSDGGATVLGKRIPNARARGRIGYLPENHRYPGYLTGREVLRFFGAMTGASSAELSRRIPTVMDLVGMSARQGHKVKTYSRGMVQRLGLAQSLIHDPDLLFLDEPTEGLDPVGRKEIRDILQRLSKAGKTIFLNSHILSEVERISHRIAILHQGKLLKEGTVDELTSTESCYEIGVDGEADDAFKHQAAATLLRLEYTPQSITAYVETTGELNRIIDLLRGHQIPIISITKKKKSLEDSFLKLIRREVSP
jgi:ABC-2 type transport system ATP-binding protein